MSTKIIADALSRNGLPSLVPRDRLVFSRRNGRRVRSAGVYVLAFSDGEYYVGETLDFASRLRAHERRFRDIEQVAFLPVKRTAGWKHVLRTIEREKLWALHDALDRHGIRSRCIKGPRSIVSRDFDEILAEEERDVWYSGEECRLADDVRSPASGELAKYAERFATFCAGCSHADGIMRLVNRYRSEILPRPWRSEAWFWSVSCAPRVDILTRFNVGWQTTLDIFKDSDGSPYFQIYLTEQLARRLDPKFDQRRSKRLVLKSEVSRGAPLSFNTSPIDLVKGGPDQVALCTGDPDVVVRALEMVEFRAVLRAFAGGLMQQDSCPWGESHCWQFMRD